ncbi:ABC transporter substrate-binding protein [Microbacterium sp. X-17]|uniref:ABC transporter substrate-binding protein n=1 Tax=Microbacterium sp. X-17 TaxID=3144404 RepID=UPI0031F4C078
MTIRRSISLAAIAVAGALALSACASTAPSTNASAAATPVAGGDLTFAIGTDPVSLNPSGVGSGNNTWYVTRQLVDSLLYQNPDTGELQPWLATSYEANADATVFTFHLREGVTFSDGTPFTAASVKGTFDDIVAAGAASGITAGYITGYDKTVVVDDHTAEVHFTKPNAAFPNSTAFVGLGIVGAATLAVPFDQRSDGKAVVGTGPFTLDSYTKDVSTVLRKRADYAWGPAALGNSGAPYLDSVTFQVVPEASVRTGSLESGQVDVIAGVQPADADVLEGDGHPLVWRGNPGLSFGLGFNEQRVSDPTVREAIARGIDSAQVRDTVLNDRFAVGTSALAKNTPGWADESAAYAYDPKRAAQLLDAAGWVAGADGIRAKNGQPLSLKLTWSANFGPNQTALELVQQQLKAVGIDVQLVQTSLADYIQIATSGDFDLSWGNLSRADGDVLRTNFSTDATNYDRIDDPTLEALLQKQLVPGDTAARNAVLADVQARIASQYHYIPVFELTSIFGTQANVHGVTLGADSRLNPLLATWIQPAS